MEEKEILTANEKDGFIQTPQEILDAVSLQLSNLLDEYFPEHIKFDNSRFTIQKGSSQIMVLVRPYTTTEACVEFYSNVVTGANITPELMHFLLRKNAELHFGAFGLIFDNTITFSHTILGSSLNPQTFKLILTTIAVICDHYDDIIVDLAGGKRAADLTSDLESE
ncbi:MAG: YbjN domain-containing protein [Ignavibacteria bacterium]|nr:YbjN domain-containing protein [Ignavibacteria bacterium]